MKPRSKAPAGIRSGRRRRLLGLLLSLSLLVLIAWVTGAAAQAPLALARQAMWRRDDDQARRWLAIAENLDSTNTEVQRLLARIERHAGSYDKAAAHLSTAQSLGMDQETIRREKMLTLAQIGQLEGIEAQINAWLAEADQTDRREISEALANGLAKSARFDDANRLLNAWRRDFPDDPEPDFRLGRIDEHLRQKDDAEKHYRSAVEKDARYYPAVYALARVLLERRQVKEALAYYRTCAELPHPAAAQVGMGICLKALGRTEEARRLFHDAATVDEASRVASYEAVGATAERFLAAAELGKLESEAGDFHEAERWLRLAVESNPRDTAARYAWAVALRGAERREEAGRQFELVRVARQALDEAGKLHDRIDDHPDDVEARYRLGVIILKYDSERTGLYWLNTALEYDPRHAPTHRALAEHFASKADESPEFRRLADYHQSRADRYDDAP